MKETTPIRVVIQHPSTPEDRQELARSAARVQAEHILSSLRAMNCSACRKLELLDAVIQALEQTPSAGEHAHG